MQETIKIFVWMPSWTWFPYPEVILNLCNQDLPDWVELHFERKNIVDRMPIQLARNELIQKFLYNAIDYDYFLWCDDDNPPNTDVVKHLISHRKDVVSALVPLRKWPYRLCIIKNWKPMESIEWLDWPLIEVENIWTWCVLLSHKIVSDVWNHTKWHPYQFTVEDTIWDKIDDHKELYKNQEKYVIDWKERYMLNKDWTLNIQQRQCWEDLFFGERAKELGYKFYADLRATCYHFTWEVNKRKVLNEEWNDLSSNE